MRISIDSEFPGGTEGRGVEAEDYLAFRSVEAEQVGANTFFCIVGQYPIYHIAYTRLVSAC